jgi:hypothetical protein
MEVLHTSAFNHKGRPVVKLSCLASHDGRPPCILIVLERKKHLSHIKLSDHAKEQLATTRLHKVELPAEWNVIKAVVDDATGMVVVKLRDKTGYRATLVDLKTLQFDTVDLRGPLCGMTVNNGRLFAATCDQLLIMDLRARTSLQVQPTSLYNFNITDHWLIGQWINKNTVMLTHPETLSYNAEIDKNSTLAARRRTDAIVIRWAVARYSGVYISSDIMPSCSLSDNELVVQHGNVTIACPFKALQLRCRGDEFNVYIEALANGMRERVQQTTPIAADSELPDVSAAHVDSCTLATVFSATQQIRTCAIAVGHGTVVLVYERGDKRELAYVPRTPEVPETPVFTAQELAGTKESPYYAFIRDDFIDLYYPDGFIHRYKLVK